MRFDIAHEPSYAITTAHLDAGESILTEGGAMVSMDSGITIETKAKGGSSSPSVDPYSVASPSS